MRHHFQDHRYGFGVSSPLWDVVFRTLPAVGRASAATRQSLHRRRCVHFTPRLFTINRYTPFTDGTVPPRKGRLHMSQVLDQARSLIEARLKELDEERKHLERTLADLTHGRWGGGARAPARVDNQAPASPPRRDAGRPGAEDRLREPRDHRIGDRQADADQAQLRVPRDGRAPEGQAGPQRGRGYTAA